MQTVTLDSPTPAQNPFGQALVHFKGAPDFSPTRIAVPGPNGFPLAKFQPNPHTYFDLDVAEPDGSVINWCMEMGSPNGLMRQGWTRNTLKVGDIVSVEGSRAKDKSHVGNARVVILAATGKRLFAASSQTDTPQR